MASTRPIWPHSQVERIAATEPVRLEVPGVSQLAAQLQEAVAKPVAAAVKPARRKQQRAGQRRPLPGQGQQGAALMQPQQMPNLDFAACSCTAGGSHQKMTSVCHLELAVPFRTINPCCCAAEDDLDKRLLDRWDDIFKTRDKDRGA